VNIEDQEFSVNRFAVIFGSKGMLARALAGELMSRGVSFLGMDLPECDLRRSADVASVFERFQPTLVFNCAAHTRVDACEDERELAFDINGYCVGTLAEMCKAFDAKLIHVSTDFVFDGQAGRPYKPQDKTNPVSAYGLSKQLGEKLIQQIAPRHWVIVRTAWLYGIGGASFPKTMVELARQGKPLRVVNDQFGCPTFTEDLAATMVDLALSRTEGIHHCTNCDPTNWYEFAEAVFEEFDLSPDLAPISTKQYLEMRPKQARRPASSVLDCSSLEAALGRKMRPWREALADFHKRVDEKGSF
jgi:dTDP-4-dehydrorhamnose reductase